MRTNAFAAGAVIAAGVIYATVDNMNPSEVQDANMIQPESAAAVEQQDNPMAADQMQTAGGVGTSSVAGDVADIVVATGTDDRADETINELNQQVQDTMAAADTATEGQPSDLTETIGDNSTAVASNEGEARLLDLEGVAEVLESGTFDAERVITSIENSDLPETQKITLISGIDAAQDDPEALTRVLAQLEEALQS